MKDNNVFSPLTNIYESRCVKNSADVYEALFKVSKLDPDMAGKHIGLIFPAAMKCELHLRSRDEHVSYSIEPMFMRDMYIRDVHGCKMRQPDVVIAPTQCFGYVTLYTLDNREDFGINASVTFAFSDLVSLLLKKPTTVPYKQPWYKRLFS